MRRPEETRVSGWQEWLGLPDINIPGIEATIDTGLENSVLHTTFIEHFRQRGDLWVRFAVNPLPGKEEVRIICQAPVKNHVTVQTADSHEKTLFVIESNVTLGGKNHVVDIVLGGSQNEHCPFHLGRNALKELKLLVDPNRTNYLGTPDESIYDQQLKAC